MKFMSEKDSDVRCKEYVTSCKDDIGRCFVHSQVRKLHLCRAGWNRIQKKTHEDKEMVFAKLCVRGKPVELFIKCQRMTYFGGTDANSLQASIDKPIHPVG